LNGRRIGLFGGSFNPAHRGHRHVSLNAIRALALDEMWWLVSPGNPLKAGAADMAPLAARLASARAMARRAPIRATAIEARLGTRYTIDTIVRLQRLYPRTRFIWLMGADNLAQFHRWRNWRGIARAIPIAVIARPRYDRRALADPATAWLRRFERRQATAKTWTTWSLPAIVRVRFHPDPTSATAVRAADPHWHSHMPVPRPRS
jgi:nicotinate-nucleotide adenylyltransferase